MLENLRVLSLIIWFNSFPLFVCIGCSILLIKEKIQERKETAD